MANASLNLDPENCSMNKGVSQDVLGTLPYDFQRESICFLSLIPGKSNYFSSLRESPHGMKQDSPPVKQRPLGFCGGWVSVVGCGDGWGLYIYEAAPPEYRADYTEP
jgi:hypothetical protein